MAGTCVNINSKEFIALVREVNMNPTILAAKVAVWQYKNGIDNFPTKEDLGISNNTVNYSLKSVNILLLDNTKNIFAKGKKNNWSLEKILEELQIPRDQINIILDSNFTDREDIITYLLVRSTFTVEINTATESSFERKRMRQYGEYNPELDATYKEDIKTTVPTKYYSNLTVPGGTNYTEQEIATPVITPSIKGHAQFATDKGIGWFRSDEQVVEGKRIIGLEKYFLNDESGFNRNPENEVIGGKSTKTRRILEVQSDLFQKGRNRSDVVKVTEQQQETFRKIRDEQSFEEATRYLDNIKENQFLQLLNKDNNWVRFFIQSIIQDSDKKGYEKILFPSGNTAGKVEGHTTLEEFKKQKESRIKKLEDEQKPIIKIGDSVETIYKDGVWRFKLENGITSSGFFNTSLEAENFAIKERKLYLKTTQGEIIQLKEELKRIETEGFGALRPIYDFYENTITNNLNKLYGKNNVKRITDEYGNTWNEITLENVNTEVQLSKGIEVQKNASRQIEEAFDGFYSKLDTFENTNKHIDYLANNTTDSVATTEDKIARMQRAFDAVVMIDTSLEVSGKLLGKNNPISKRNNGKPVILINPNLLFGDTVFHEFGHLYIDLLGGMADPKVAEAVTFLQGTRLWYEVADAYPELPPDMLAKEVLATALGVEGDLIYSGNQEKKSIWRKMKEYFLNILSNMFGNKSMSALEQLASEMLTGKVRTNSTSSFNTLVDQNSKLNLENPTQDNIDKLFKSLSEKYKKKEQGSVRYYEDADTGEKYVKSVTEFSKAMTSRLFATRKGDPESKFTEGDELTKNNYKIILTSASIPLALDKALNDYFHDQIPGTSLAISADQDEYWSNTYNKFLKMLSAPDAIIAVNIDDAIEKDFALINKVARKYQEESEVPIQAGNIIHKALQEYIEQGIPFPQNIIDTNSVLINTIKDVIDAGHANGSKFYSEQILFSSSAKMPGTADLIEITKDGKHRIHDFKTTDTFLNKKTGARKDVWEMYIQTGYLNQVLIYSTILQEYGIEAADNHLNIISIEIDRDQVVVDDPNSTIKVHRVLNKNLNSKDKELQNHIINANKRILGQFRNPNKLTEYNMETQDTNIDNLVQKLHTAVKDLRKLYIKTSETNREAKIFKNLHEKIEKLMGQKNKQVILLYITNMRDALNIVYANSTNNKAYLNSEYLRNLEFLRQASTFTADIRLFITEQDDTLIADKDSLLELLDETDAIAVELLKIQKFKTKELAVRVLAENSNFMEGLWKEKFEIEARKLGKKGDEIQKYVYEQLKKESVQLEIETREDQYWTSIFNNGYTDIRFFEWLIADPGMNKSQFVQVTKNVIDKADQAKRIDLDDSMAELVAWHEGLKIDKTGDPKKIWGKFAETAVYIDEEGNKKSHLNATLIPEFTSDRREAYMKYQFAIDYYDRLMIAAKQRNDSKKYDMLIEKIKNLKEERNLALKDYSKEKRVHPQFAKLSQEEQEVLRFIHRHLERADLRLSNRPHAKLVTSSGDGLVYNLPKQRKTELEAIYEGKGIIKRFASGVKDFWRPPADEDELNVTDKEIGMDELHTSSTDILGDPLYEIPVFFRRQLEDPELQSFDIPTLLAMNEDTTIQFEHFSVIEADLFMITQALKDTKSLKTDALVNKKITHRFKNGLSKTLKSDGNLVLSAVQASINNRFYKRSYAGVYSKANYKLIKGAEALNKYTSKLLLAGNYGSAAMTGLQGSIYRFIEGVAGEDFSSKDVANGSRKAWADMPNVIADSQRQFPKSLTMLLIRRFGLDTQYKALVNKFIQDNIATKNLDEASFFALTSAAETIVTSSLMYTLLSNIKVMDSAGNFINNKGEKVSKENAMSLDEAYSVEDGKLVLNKHVVYTENNLTHKFKDNIHGEKTVASTQIGNYIRSKYADLYGQYNQDMKSVAEMYWAGKLAFSMKKWIPRGYHRRWRGISSVRQTFEQMREEQNIEKRFYSQDQRKFQEGYYSTGFRYMWSLYVELNNKKLAFMTAVKNVNNTLTTHDIANLARLRAEIGVIIVAFVGALALRAIALGLDDDDKDRDKVYMAAYLVERISIESNTFWNPFALKDNLENPAASINTLNRVQKLLWNLFGIAYDKDLETYELEIFSEYEKGNRKGELKLERNIENLIPFYKKVSQLWGILGYDSKESIKDSYDYMIR